MRCVGLQDRRSKAEVVCVMAPSFSKAICDFYRESPRVLRLFPGLFYGIHLEHAAARPGRAPLVLTDEASDWPRSSTVVQRHFLRSRRPL